MKSYISHDGKTTVIADLPSKYLTNILRSLKRDAVQKLLEADVKLPPDDWRLYVPVIFAHLEREAVKRCLQWDEEQEANELYWSNVNYELREQGWKVISENPPKIRHKDKSEATGQAAEIIIETILRAAKDKSDKPEE